jgi:hypothetical protein
MGICFLSLVLTPKRLLLHHVSTIEFLLVVLPLSSVVVLSNPRFAPASLHISNLLELVKGQSRSCVRGHAHIFVVRCNAPNLSQQIRKQKPPVPM